MMIQSNFTTVPLFFLSATTMELNMYLKHFTHKWLYFYAVDSLTMQRLLSTFTHVKTKGKNAARCVSRCSILPGTPELAPPPPTTTTLHAKINALYTRRIALTQINHVNSYIWTQEEGVNGRRERNLLMNINRRHSRPLEDTYIIPPPTTLSLYRCLSESMHAACVVQMCMCTLSAFFFLLFFKVASWLIMGSHYKINCQIAMVGS